MTEPILTRDQILKIVRKTLKENGDRDKLSSESFVKLYEAIEEAWLEKVCGEPAAHMFPSDLERFKTNETFAHAYSVAVGNPDEHSVPLYALTRSKP
ncbi:hypothetical protein [Burkholderia sp. BCC0398]|uniref:hypothetical protein n=1 Tax=Burkholderia sp. BCC0398 TaxID=2676297 RepID=UPI00158A7645|nr:hypothetical protein [Burkholderia sp. BCC0398]